MSAVRISLAALALVTVVAAQPAAAQTAMGGMRSGQAASAMPRLFVEGLGGAVVPTFDIANTAKAGAMFGATVGYVLNPRWVLMGEFDYGHHKDKATGTVTINTLHYMAKLGYSLTGPRERGWEALVNLGAGAVGFDVAGTTKTYLAINAGAKITYNFSRSLGFVISPQGDIAFSKKADLNTTNAWVWPVSAGLRIRF
jgi:Outer membrane protein beta-barrel domain